MIKFLKSLPKLDALALSISGPLKEEDLLEMVIKSQPGISMFYWDHFPTNPDLLIQLSCLSSIHIFGIGKTLHTLLHTLPRECVMQMLQSPFMQQLTHFHGITILERSYTIKVPLPDYAEKEIKSLKKGKLEDFEDKNGLLHDVFMQQISLLGL